ncbi:hypothetical protein CGGC5_v005870 [Colletotrichum fructicola Nara gc5]|uniref:Uncharacterized protein n=1 Tax=Colletotrichum fructicola (strain Nara gc5) TaxID=1213859 RepID=A0A7J6JBL8_COLFN|nr:hypothetical protein CGGC5_v005870 [Colletotrichum fructicola Nara gc5]KAF4878846.1 hypothetical protein CGCFRS4_v016110 [Colletotrichum fructicola]
MGSSFDPGENVISTFVSLRSIGQRVNKRPMRERTVRMSSPYPVSRTLLSQKTYTPAGQIVSGPEVSNYRIRAFCLQILRLPLR